MKALGVVFTLSLMISLNTASASLNDALCSSYAVSEDILQSSRPTRDYLRLLYYLAEQGRLSPTHFARIINSKAPISPYSDSEVDASLLAFQAKFEELVQDVNDLD